MGDFELLQMYFENFKNKMDHENYRKLTFEFLLLSPPWCMVECIQRINNQKGHGFTTTPSYQSLSCLYGCQKEAKVSLSVILEAGKGPFKYYVIIRLGGWVQKMAIFAYYQYRKSPKTLHILSFFFLLHLNVRGHLTTRWTNLKPLRNKKGLTFVGVLIFLNPFFATGSKKRIKKQASL